MRNSEIFSLGPGKHRAADNLYLVVRTGGRDGFYRNWLAIFSVKGKRIEKSLGSAKKVPLSLAKDRVTELRSRIIRGLPLEDKVVEKEKHLLKDVYQEAISVREQVAAWSNEKHRLQWISTIETYVLPALGNKDVADITRDDVLSILRPIWKTKTDTAIKVRGRLETILSYCMRRGWRTVANPAQWRGNLEFDLPQPKKIMDRKHHEAATLAELQAAVPLLLKTPSGKATLFGALTACRCEEFLKAQWSEIDLRARVFSVPPERRKDRRRYPHRVPLSRQAVELLKSIPRETDFVFPGTRGKHMNLETPRQTLRRLLKRAVTMHGCRSTFSDWCAEHGKDPVLREKSLMHATGNEVSQAYQRSDLLEQRRVLMQEWADALFTVHIPED